jgi:putative Holliday junction resolvase
MGLDVGERRIGVALADELGMIASPLAAVRRGQGDLGAIRALLAKHRVTHLVVGLPTGLSGREGPQAAAVRAFALELEKTLGPAIAIEFWDERLTTVVAERMLRERGATREQRRREVDAMAAAVTLQGYLDAQRAHSVRRGVPEGGEAG